MSSTTTNGCTIVDADRKEFETMRAKAALARCALHQLSSGGYLICMGGLAREVPDLRQVAAVLAQMGVRA